MKTNLFLLAAGFSLALAFTFSCSSGDDNEGGGSTAACKYTTEFRNQTVDVCEYWSKEDLAKAGHTIDRKKRECKEDAEVHDNGGTFYESCPSGYVLTCRDEDDGGHHPLTYYLYGDAFKDIDCDYYFRNY